MNTVNVIKDIVVLNEKVNKSKPLLAWEYKSAVEQLHEMNAKPFRIRFSSSVLIKYPRFNHNQVKQLKPN